MSNILTQLAKLSGGVGRGASISQKTKSPDGRPVKVSFAFDSPTGYGDGNIVDAVRNSEEVILSVSMPKDDEKGAAKFAEKKVFSGREVVGVVANMYGIDAALYPADRETITAGAGAPALNPTA
jgi:hypothetical protein